MCWSPNMPTTHRSIARRKSMRAKASPPTAPPWPIGWAAPPSALRPVHARLFELLKQSSKLFADETTAPVLDPGRGRTKKGQLWAYARDERPWAGPDPPGVAYAYAPDRKHVRPAEHLAGFSGKLQVDGYGAYAELAEGGNVELAFCWSHVRGTFMRSRLPRPRRSPARPSS